MSERRSWTEVAEPLAIMATAVGAVMTVILNQVAYVAAPVSLALLLSWVNRQKLDRQALQSSTTEMAQVTQQLGNDFEALRAAVLAMGSQLNLSPLESEIAGLDEAIAAAEENLQNRLATLETVDSAALQAELSQLRNQSAYLLESQANVLQRLDRLPATERLENLERSVTEALTRLQAGIAPLESLNLTDLQAQLDQLLAQVASLQAAQLPLQQHLEQLSPSPEIWQPVLRQLESLQAAQLPLQQHLEQLAQDAVSPESWQQVLRQLDNLQATQTALQEQLQQTTLPQETWESGQAQLASQLVALQNDLQNRLASLDVEAVQASSLQLESIRENTSQLGTQLAHLVDSLASVTQQLETLPLPAPSLTVEGLESRLAPLQSQLSALTSAAPTPLTAEALKSHLAPLQAQLAAIAPLSGEALEGRLAQLQQQLESLAAIRTEPSASGSPDFLEQRFSQLSNAIHQLQQQLSAVEKPELSALNENLARVRSQLANLEKSVEESAARLNFQNPSLPSKLPEEAEKWLGKLVQRVKSLQSREQDADLTDEFADFEDEDEDFAESAVAPAVSVSTEVPIPPPVASPEGNAWQCVQTLSGNQSAIAALDLSADRTTLVASDYEVVKVWDLTTGELRSTLSSDATEAPVTSVSLSPDGQLLASAKGDIEIWNLSTGQPIRTLEAEDWTTIVAISPDGKTLASSGGDPVDQNGSLQVWDLTSGELIRTNYYVACEISSLAFSPNGQLLVLTGSNLDANKGIIQLWHLETGKPRFTLEPAVTPYGVMFNPDATMFAVGCSDQSIKLWNSATGGLVQTFTGHQGSVYAVAISSDGKLLASGSEDGTIVLWGLETGEKLQTLSGHRGGVRAIAFSRDRQTLISGSQDRTLKVWQYS
ncbi:MAG: hypothetical protein F6K32_11575 [Desertifilum sp. SIO1I2]|nr:hypothetical protein [Desertifilum sp. SIO1I2]